MDKKNLKQKRTFVPQSIGDTLRKVNRKFASKYNRTEFVINSKWPEIAGSYFKEYSEYKGTKEIGTIQKEDKDDEDSQLEVA